MPAYDGQVYLVDDSYWRQISISANNICSYRLMNPAGSSVFELQVNNPSNLVLGAYFGKIGSDGHAYDVTDLGIFTPETCAEIDQCVFDRSDGFVQLKVEGSDFMQLNLIASDEYEPLSAGLNYRLVNMDEHSYILVTMVLMGFGMALLGVFSWMFFSAMTTPINGPDEAELEEQLRKEEGCAFHEEERL